MPEHGALRLQPRDIAGAFQSAALALMPGALRTVGQRFPDVRVEMVQREPDGALHETSWARAFDLVVAEQYPGHSTSWLPGLVRSDLTTDAIPLAVSRDSAVLDLASVRDCAWVMEPRGTASRHFAEQTCRPPSASSASAWPKWRGGTSESSCDALNYYLKGDPTDDSIQALCSGCRP